METPKNILTTPEIPLGLRSAMESGNCVLFVGAGIGPHLFASNGAPLPDGAALATEMAKHFGIQTGGQSDLSKVAEVVELNRGRPELESYLRNRFSDIHPDEKLQWLLSFRWKAIYTTNYDDGIEKAYAAIREPQQRPVTISITPDLVNCDPRFDVPIYHLHGTLFGPDKPHIVITGDDYARFRECRRMLFEKLKFDSTTTPILYVGYANRDPNWNTVLTEISGEFYPTPMPQSYRVSPETDPLDKEILKKRKNIETLEMTFSQFRDVGVLIRTERLDNDRLAAMRTGIPADLMGFFEKTPVPVLRLLDSWDYVNASPFHVPPNVSAFLKGDRPNWSLVGSKQHFQRDIEDDVYDELIDYATDASRHPRTCIVFGPAGYGTSTLLMALAARLVNEKAGPVFMLKSGHHLNLGDVEFACSLFDSRPFFVVDNAADCSGAIETVEHRLKELHKPSIFLLGERLNEWRQCGSRIRGKEFEIMSLSDPEITRLLDCLSSHRAMGVLEPLARELQIAAIKGKFGKELLVAMREATEGKSFDAILEDEFRGIRDELSKRLYLAVCCFHQHGVCVRDTVLAELLNTPLAEIYRSTGSWTDGVVSFELYDASTGHYIARARHRTIAAIVWERCAEPRQQEELVQRALQVLNLTFRTDRLAFDHFICSDHLVDTIRDFESRIRFFDTACRKDPENPYVRQHYARMLVRSGKDELALGQINTGIELGPEFRILYHTKGHVLSHLAMTIDSREIARRRLVQSEESYQRALSMYAKDGYCYQGLAELYFGWATRNDTPDDESVEYLAKAEETVNKGLKVARVRDSLWIESAKIQGYLGNQPSRLAALEKAVSEHPGSTVARYILGRAYRQSQKPEKALAILEPIIKLQHDEFRAFIEYGLSMLDMGRGLREAIAVLRLSSLYGLGNARYIATLGGMLFLDQQFTESQKIFSESHKHNFSASEMSTVQFCPTDPVDHSKPLILTGKVAVVKAGFSLLDVPEYPRLLCPGSKYRGLIMSEGLKVAVELGFSAKSPIAQFPIATAAGA